MILIADSGSSKTAWWLIDKGERKGEYLTSGINPFYQSENEISFDLKLSFHSIKTSEIEKIHFYGAGCHFPEKKQLVKSGIQSLFNDSEIEVNNDLLGACRGLFGDKHGIACILGTGSNSCFYDGKEIKENISPLGFILGDEGSGAVLGKRLVADVLKNQLPKELKEKFLTQYNVSTADILNSVYKRSFPNRYLAGFTPFLYKNIEEESIYNIVYQSFHDFFTRNVMQYDYKHNEIAFIGSVAFHFKDILHKIANDLGMKISKIEQSPMNGLLAYHSE